MNGSEKSIDQQFIVELLLQYHNFEPGAAESARETLLAFPKASLIDVLSSIVMETDPTLRVDAAETLLRLDPALTIPIVLPLLADSDRSVRWNTCGLLHDWGDHRATEGLVKLLREDGDGGVRHIAAWALGACGDKSALPALEYAAATDEGEDFEGRPVCLAAADAVAEIKARSCQ